MAQSFTVTSALLLIAATLASGGYNYPFRQYGHDDIEPQRPRHKTRGLVSDALNGLKDTGVAAAAVGLAKKVGLGGTGQGIAAAAATSLANGGQGGLLAPTLVALAVKFADMKNLSTPAKAGIAAFAEFIGKKLTDNSGNQGTFGYIRESVANSMGFAPPANYVPVQYTTQQYNPMVSGRSVAMPIVAIDNDVMSSINGMNSFSMASQFGGFQVDALAQAQQMQNMVNMQNAQAQMNAMNTMNAVDMTPDMNTVVPQDAFIM